MQRHVLVCGLRLSARLYYTAEYGLTFYKWRRVGEYSVDYNTNRPGIDSKAVALLMRLQCNLRRQLLALLISDHTRKIATDVCWRATRSLQERHSVYSFCQTKIRDFDDRIIASRQQHVIRLQIPMTDASAV